MGNEEIVRLITDGYVIQDIYSLSWTVGIYSKGSKVFLQFCSGSRHIYSNAEIRATFCTQDWHVAKFRKENVKSVVELRLIPEQLPLYMQSHSDNV